MQVYFGFTVAGDRSSLDTARRMVQVLESRGHVVLTRHLVDEDARQQDRLLKPEEVYERDMRWLAQAEIFIAEVSGSSFGLGYEAGYVLGATQKRAVLFYRTSAAKRISLLILGNTHPHCTLVPYNDDDEVAAWLAARF